MAIKFYGKSQEVAQQVLTQFESGDLPEKIAHIFVNRSDNIPCGAWSWRNRLLTAMVGTSDARGFKQWQKAGRKVKKGAKAFHILGPCIGKKKDKETGEEVPILFGFKSIPVFAMESTEVFDQELWEKSGGIDTEEESRLASLPFRSVAESWGINVTSYNGEGVGYLGYFRHSVGNQAIALGVENLDVWAHELTHAADHKNGTLTKGHGQKVDNEIVAELGACVLLTMTGYKTEANLSFAWDYIQGYAKGDKDKALKHCFALLERVCECINLILETAVNYEDIKLQHNIKAPV